jgi:peptidyl-prolyl cis-trans isomerase-like 3
VPRARTITVSFTGGSIECGYQLQCIIHLYRNIRNFMIQTGDPAGTGKGGQSIWGRPFADEIRSTLKFNTRGILAMANAGPDTNKSQFFVSSFDLIACRARCLPSSLIRRLLTRSSPISKGSTPSSESVSNVLTVCRVRILTIRQRVIDGADSTLDAMERVPVNKKNRPLHEIRLKSVSIGYPSRNRH